MSTRAEARFNPAKLRARIRCAPLLKNLEEHALGQRPMSGSEVRSACYLIDQAIGKAPQPIVGDPANPIVVQVVNYAKSA